MKPLLAKYRAVPLNTIGRLCRMNPAGHGLEGNLHPGRFNIVDLKLLPVALPSLAEKQEIVRRVESLLALADQIEARLAAAQRHVDALTPSLLARAFAGKLVSQDPTDEPASALLERMHSRSPDQKGRSK
jgi:type I restriction enzyme S subunit